MDESQRINIYLTDEQIMSLMRGMPIYFISNERHIMLKTEKTFKYVDGAVIKDLFNYRDSPHVIEQILCGIV